MAVTSGAGEPSALNGVAGCYAEYQPVIHIAGKSPSTLQEQRISLHHTLGDSGFRIFPEMFAKVTAAQLNLVNYKAKPSMLC